MEALLVSPGQFFGDRVDLAALVARRALPTMYYDREFAEVGALISYGSDLADQYHQTGIYTGRVLKGARPADMPVTHAEVVMLHRSSSNFVGNTDLRDPVSESRECSAMAVHHRS